MQLSSAAPPEVVVKDVGQLLHLVNHSSTILYLIIDLHVHGWYNSHFFFFSAYEYLHILKTVNDAPVSSQQDRRHETTTNPKSVKNWYIEHIASYQSFLLLPINEGGGDESILAHFICQ